eukprot:6825854-Pyramimonas_sp.AAC.2
MSLNQNLNRRSRHISGSAGPPHTAPVASTVDYNTHRPYKNRERIALFNSSQNNVSRPSRTLFGEKFGGVEFRSGERS